MTEILVVGGGFAGVWSAVGAVRTARLAGADDVHVTLVSSGDDLVIRPRLYEADPEAKRVSLDRVLGPVGVRRVAGTVTDIDVEDREVTYVGRDGTTSTLDYDRLVLAAGSRVVRPQIEGAEHLFDVDTMTTAAVLDAHLHRLPASPAGEGRWTAVVVGAGFTGLEIATELVHRMRELAGGETPRVVLLDRNETEGAPLGDGPHDEIVAALDALGIERRLGVSVQRLTPDEVVLEDGTTIPTRTVVWTVGMLASPLTEQIGAERDDLGRLTVDEHLEVVGVPGVYAAGDTGAALADADHHVLQCCQHAVPLGKVAGHNVAAGAIGREQVAFDPDPYVTCLDLGEHGAVFTQGWDREVASTGQEAKALKTSINTEWIVPPVDDAEMILEHADHRVAFPAAQGS